MAEIKSHVTIDYSSISIDVEDGVNIWMRDLFNIQMDPTSRVVDNVNALLGLFNDNSIKGTFFILGEVASAFPSLIKNIASCGHEIGVHGYYHDQLFKLSYGKSREDIYKAKSILEEITGKRVFGFRAPAFSIVEETEWALELLSELEFTYDSSIVPAKCNRYGWPGVNKDIHRILLPNDRSLIEVPISVVKVFGKTIPACGGGYLRYFPYFITRSSFLAIQKKRPVIVYLHPYEIDTGKYPDFFYKAMASLSFRKRLPVSLYRINKGTVKKKLAHLMKEFHFKPVIEIINELDAKSSIPVSYWNNISGKTSQEKVRNRLNE